MSEFKGFPSPERNYSHLPHVFIEVLPEIKTISEMKVMLYILRHTWGFQEYDAPKQMTLDEFMNGRKLRDGTRMDNGTGLTKPSIITGLRDAEEHGFIQVDVDDHDPARVKKAYRLVMQGSKVFTPDVKSFYPSGKKSLPRSEKDTSERNPREKEEHPRYTLVLFGGQDTYADGHFIDVQKPDFIDACNAIFYAWLDALEAAGRKPDTIPQDLWAKHKDAIKALAMNRRTPEQIAAYVAYVYDETNGDDFYRKIFTPIPPAAISTTIGTWLIQEQKRISGEQSSGFTSPLPPPRQLTDEEIAARLAAKEKIMKGEDDGV